MKFLAVLLCVSSLVLCGEAKKLRFGPEFYIQLQNAKFEKLLQVPHLILIVDPDDARLTADQNAELRRQGKTILAYVSVGQAESFRSYWDSEWTKNSSSIYYRPDVDYANGMLVEYWRPEWKQTITEYLAKSVFPFGYSGLLVDYLETYQKFAQLGRRTAAQEMIDLTQSVADAARTVDPSALIVAQDAIGLWELSDSFKAMIDGMSVEMVWFNDVGVPRRSMQTAHTLEVLRKINLSKKLVLVEEYVQKNSQVCAAYKKCYLEGFLCGVFDPVLGGVARECVV